ncbi:MAG: DAK2 domain-containing protein [Chloroflexi bacterium]|nr:DAK2 domain-containing protein [Chloroflexota bacterium]
MRDPEVDTPPGAVVLHHCDGAGLKRAMQAATAWLEKNASAINSLNVFPVPDGDTGSNMLLTMQSTMKAVAASTDGDVATVGRDLAHGALMGARGNSGVILSQILRGFAQGLDRRQTIDCESLAAALAEASATAYKAVSKPVEGTMLTVVRETADAARVAASQTTDLVVVLEAICAAARASVARTPYLLRVLRDAGVVDAGGQGLYVILEGILRYLRGELEEEVMIELAPEATAAPRAAGATGDDAPYGYCTEFLLEGQDLPLDRMRERITALGDSALVVGDGSLVRVHVHTFDPGAALSYATSIGVLRQVKVENMQDQHRDFLAAFAPAKRTDGLATVAVVVGKGLSEVFTSLGASAIVPGGQSMNPSTEELLAAVESVRSDRVILLPNNKNVVATAAQIPSLTTKEIRVVPTQTIPQGIASLMALNAELSFEDNAAVMCRAGDSVRTIEVTRAVRAAAVNGLQICEGQIIGLLDGELLSAGEDSTQVIGHLLERASAAAGEVITVYWGADIGTAEAEGTAKFIRAGYPGQQVELIEGGQPHYHYIISVE